MDEDEFRYCVLDALDRIRDILKYLDADDTAAAAHEDLAEYLARLRIAQIRFEAFQRVQARLRLWYAVEAQDRTEILPGYYGSLSALRRSSGHHRAF